MSYSPIVPAELTLDGNGIPFAAAYDDSYHTAAGGLEQARHVFLAGNDLLGENSRWQGRHFVILETGFGLGLNFLCTWQAWKAAPSQAGQRLHYVAVEKHPFRLADLARLHAQWPELSPYAGQLQSQWPLPLPGLHRLDFGDVVLTLGFGDAADLLPQLSLSCDAFFLDGFAPNRNPEMWSDAIVAELRRLAAPGATLATWTIAGDLRRRLTSADFSLERRTGFGFKREMLVGRLQGAVSNRQADMANTDLRAPTLSRKKIAVIGAGIAGASTAHALALRGHEVVVIDSATMPASGASGNLAGVFRPLPARDDSRLARLLRAGFMLGQRRYSKLEGIRYGWTGVLHIARDAAHADTQKSIATEHAMPPEFCRFVEREEASQLAGWPVEQGGWWFPTGGWLNPPSTCRALLAGIDCRFNFQVEKLDRTGDSWHIVGKTGVIEADEVVLANGIGAPALVPDVKLPIRAGRGLVSHIPESATPRFDIVATRLGYVTPAVDGLRCAGATMTADDLDAAPRIADHIENLYRLDMVLPGFGTNLDPAKLEGRVSFRPMSPDRLPIVGPLSASEGLWIIDGFGARGLVFAPICAELLASQICGEPLPLESDLVSALAPTRFRKKR
jgi:tRNA 5-methylaminomethyl-2-thiouridine biosynthesis bifunctional protein